MRRLLRPWLDFYKVISAESKETERAINLQGCLLLFCNFFLANQEKSL